MAKKLLLFLLFIPLFSVAQNTLSGTFSPVENYKWGILYQMTPTETLYTTDTKIDEKGTFAMPLDSSVVKGVYRFVYGVPPEAHNFELIYSGNEDIEFSFSEKEGATFVSSEENITWTRYKEKMSDVLETIGQIYEKSSVDPYALQLLFNLQRETQQKFEEISENLLVGSLIRASKIYIPNTYKTKKIYLQKKKENYFNNIDVTNETLQKSTFILDRTYHYIEEKKDADAVAQFIKPTETEYQKSLLLIIWQQLVSEDRIETANYLSQKYLTPIAIELKDSWLVNKLVKFESLSLGTKAPNFSWKADDSSIHWFHDVTGAETFILVFWSSSCQHCLNELPRLQKQVRTLPKGKYKVIAFGLEDEIYGWKNEILRFPEFLHIPGLGKWQNPTGKAYNVSKTPTYYVLDRDMKIVAKPEELEELVNIILEK